MSSMLPLLAQGSPETRGVERDAPPVRSTTSRPPRKQVSKACDHCRLRRVKCDHGRPCLPCRQRGLHCNVRGSHNDEARTLPQALREIQRLRSRVRELEYQLEQEQQLRGSASIPGDIVSLNTPQSTSSSSQVSPTATLPREYSEKRPSHNGLGTNASGPKVKWEGIYTATSRSEQTSYYGPSSAFYFIGRIGSYLSKSLQQSFTDHSMQPRGASKTFGSLEQVDTQEAVLRTDREVPKPSMSRAQEEYFIGLFWESHHSNIPIIAEDEFRSHYASLWQTSKPYRKQSAIADIVIAVSMQYGWVFLLSDTENSISQKKFDDASLAGRLYYRRCQNLLTAELESPTYRTLQCHIFSVVYLCCASFQNIACTTLAIAIRTAQILGLHLEPPPTMPRSEKELRKRLWGVIYTLEAKTSMKLGRPFAVHKSQMTVSPPSDDTESASFFNSSLEAYDGEVTWLTYSCQTQKLIYLTVDVYHQLFDKFDTVLGQRGLGSFYKDPQGLEICAEYLSTLIPVFDTWRQQVPIGIKLSRRGNSESLSTDRCPVSIETTAPLWLKRHRICLELTYHTTHSNLYRPFISFTCHVGTHTPITERLATASLNHAVAHTRILHQVLKETDLMNGWQEFFLWQWNATVNMVGFVLAHPVSPATANARQAIDKAIEIFEVFGRHFAVAASAAVVTRDLTEKADLLIDRLRGGIMAGAGCANGSQPSLGDKAVGEVVFAESEVPVEEIGGLELSTLETAAGITEFMDWALTVDSYNSFEDLFDANYNSDWMGSFS
ncbi:hypothetical protein G7046_g840 [Stylonectria norvegica]|nr:hypothetical protein G7046_g840 [Stylonectria norvegica]